MKDAPQFTPDEQRVLDETPMPMPPRWRGSREQWQHLVLDQVRAFGELRPAII